MIRWLLFSLGAMGAGTASSQVVFSDGFEAAACGAVTYAESFTEAPGSPWPAPWIAAGSVDVADIESGTARLRPTDSGYSLARMFAPVDTRDVEVRFSFLLEDEPTQGVGFYVRQNGGYLDQTDPVGEGYAVFLEGSFRGSPGISVWKEDDGHEIELLNGSSTVAPPQQDTWYRVRFRVHQVDAGHSRLQAKMWPATESEPAGWQVSFLDDTPSLQHVSGGIAVDSWSVLTAPSITAHTRVDDIEVEPLCNPLPAFGAIEPVAETFQFTEGPLWRGDHLLFSDIDADTIYRLDPPSGITIFRSPSNQANGLTLDIDGNLLAAEHGTRAISITDGMGRMALVDRFEGLRFNSPNDLVMATDGTLYFTDPTYGLADINDRELAFNGVFRRQLDGTLDAPFMGSPAVNQPNGVALSPDEATLYFTDTQQGTLMAFDVTTDGALANLRTLASGLTIPDGMCIDARGNVLVATWLPSIEVFSPDGAYWGSIPVPMAATNCAFGGTDRRTLYVTAQQGLYRVSID